MPSSSLNLIKYSLQGNYSAAIFIPRWQRIGKRGTQQKCHAGLRTQPQKSACCFQKPGALFKDLLANSSPSHHLPSSHLTNTTQRSALKLNIDGLNKIYNQNVHALRELNLTINAGVLGLLGPNGAGKSTLMRILATITKATSGTVSWNGEDIARAPNAVRQVLGYLPQDFGVYPNLSAVEFLEYLAAIKGLAVQAAKRRIDELLQLVNLVEVRKRPLGGFSGGMKQRVGIAQALLNDPQLLIVDEPTGGLDPEERVRFRNLLSELSGERIVILSTHIVSDIEATATDIAIISQGRLLIHAAPEVLLNTVVGKVWEWTIPSADLNLAKQKYLISSTLRRGEGVLVRALSETQPHASAQPAPAGLEDAYLYCIAKHKREHAT